MNHAEDRHDPANDRRHRLGQLLDLAQNYRGWTRKQLSAELGRDPTKLVPGSGVPKLDVIIALAKTLDWTLDDVVAHLDHLAAALLERLLLQQGLERGVQLFADVLE